MRRLVLPAAAVFVSACTQPTSLVTRPPGGYRALRFTETVRFTGAVGNTWEFPVGTMMVQDRRRERDGAELWCGPMIVRDLAAEARPTCMTLSDQTVGLMADTLHAGYQRQLPLGSTEITRLR